MNPKRFSRSRLSGSYGSLCFHLFALLVIIIIGFSIYSNTFNSPFTLDDESSIVNNVHIRLQDFDLKKLYGAAFNSVAHHRPLPNISFALNYLVGQYNVQGYHIINILIHIINGILIYLFIRVTVIISLSSGQSSGSYSFDDKNSFYGSVFAFCTTLVWLAHPAQTQSVTYLVQRMTSMAVLFYMLSLLLYIYARLTQTAWKRWLLFGFSLLSWAASLGCKEISATLPLIVFLYEWYFFRDLSYEWLKRNIKYFLVPLFIFGILAFIYLGDSPIDRILRGYETRDFTLLERVLTQARVIMLYLSLLVYPLPSRFNLDHFIETSHSLFDPATTFFSMVTIIIIIGLAVYLARKERLLSFCIFWFFINLAIESSVIGLEMVFEHRLYLPSIGFFIFIMSILFRLASYFIRKEQDLSGITNGAVKYVVFFSVPVVMLLGLATYQRNSVWQDEITLWRDCVIKSPEKARCHNNLGRAYYKQEMFDEAEIEYKSTLSLDPDYAHAYNNLGSVYASMQRYDEAVEQYRKGLEVNPGFADLWYNLGNVYKVMGNMDEAVQHYRHALSLNPGEARAHFELGGIYTYKGMYGEAEASYKTAIMINPYYIEAYHNLGNVYQKSEKLEDAMLIYKRVLALNPEIIESYNNLGILYYKMGQFEDSIAILREALSVEPDNYTVHYNLGNIYHNEGKYNEALAEYNASIRSNPDNAHASYRLALLYKEKGQLNDAIVAFKDVLRQKPDNIEALNHIGNLYFESGNMDEAVYNYNKILEIEPNNDSVHYNLGNAYFKKGVFDKAIPEYHSSIRINPDNEHARYMLASAYKRIGHLDKAAIEYKLLLNKKPDNPVYHYKLGNTYKDEGQLKDAVYEYQEALEINPNMGEALNNLATVFMLQNRDEEALRLLKKKIALYPQSIDAYYNIACIYSKQNMVEEAFSWINAAISKGFSDWKLLESDGDLANLRNSPHYEELLKNK